MARPSCIYPARARSPTYTVCKPAKARLTLGVGQARPQSARDGRSWGCMPCAQRTPLDFTTCLVRKALEAQNRASSGLWPLWPRPEHRNAQEIWFVVPEPRERERETDRERAREREREKDRERERERVGAQFHAPDKTTLKPKRTDLLKRTTRVKLNKVFFPR